jgi:hypothetical protein
MKKLFILISLLFAVTITNAQLTPIKIATYVGTTVTYEQNPTYTNSQTDTTAWINFADVDSIHFYLSTSDSAKVFVKFIYGDDVYSNVLVSAVTDSLVTTSTGWKSFNWAKIVSSCGNEITGCKLQLAFQSAGNAASTESAKYSLTYKKFRKE